MNDLQNHPLHGVGLEALLGELVRHYGWEILAEQININCFKSYPSFKSSVKFIKKTQWARERLEAFYLYKFLQYPLPSEENHELPPRNREIDGAPLFDFPAVIELGDSEFFDDPDTGPKFPSRKAVSESRSQSRSAKAKAVKAELDEEESVETVDAETDSADEEKPSMSEGGGSDPWAKWKK